MDRKNFARSDFNSYFFDYAKKLLDFSLQSGRVK